jgi:acetyl-CoA C-acetyltransferase
LASNRWRDRRAGDVGTEPKLVMMAPSRQSRKLIKKTGWSLNEVDLIELNEAFAVQAVANYARTESRSGEDQREWRRVALGHAIGNQVRGF